MERVSKTKLWIITELFSPDQTSTAFVLKGISDFIASSREVEIICGPINYQQTIHQEIDNNISNFKVTRIRSINLNKNNLFMRTLRLNILSVQLTLKFIKRSKKNESVLIVTNPAPLLLFFAFISKFIKRRFNLLVHDVFPENTIPAQIIKSNNSVLYKLLKKIFDNAYAQFDSIIVLGRDMKLVINRKIASSPKKNTKIEIIENWADIDDVFPLQHTNLYSEKWGASNKIIFLFAGNLGRTQALKELFFIIKKVTNPLVHFVFLGDGALKEKLVQYKKSNNLNNITIGSSFHRSEQCAILNACHAGIVTLAKGMEGLGVPSKSYNILASGKPILFFGDENSEISLLVQENQIGWSFNSSEPLVEFFNNIDGTFIELSDAIGKKSREIAVNKYSKSVVLEKFEGIL